MLAHQSPIPDQNPGDLPIRRSFYVRETAVGIVVLLVIFGFVMADLPTDDSVDPSRRVNGIKLSIILSIMIGAPSIRAIFACVIAKDQEVIVRNVWRTRRYRWSDIENFTIEPSGLFPLIGILNLKDGRKMRASGLGAPNPLGRPNNRTAHKLVDELNILLDYTKDHDGSLAGANRHAKTP